MKHKRFLKIFLLDVLGYALGMGIFLLFFYLIPYELESEGKVVGNSDTILENEFSFNTDDKLSQIDKRPANKTPAKDPGRGEHFDHLGTKNVGANYSEVENIYDADIHSKILEEYESDDVIISITKKDFGSGNDKVTYYVADVQVRNLSHFKTALAKTNMEQI